MGILSFFKKKEFFNEEDKARIVEAIRIAETETSGEVRIYVESKNPFMDPIDRAAELFFQLKMNQTEFRNGVLLYIAMKDHELALFGDEGIFNAVGAEYWNIEVKKMLSEFRREHITDGIVKCIYDIGQALKEKFPFVASADKNELPDEIIFGR